MILTVSAKGYVLPNMKLHQLFLERSRNRPLSVYLRLGENYRNEDNTVSCAWDSVDEDFLALIVPHLQRVEVLELDHTWPISKGIDFFRPPGSVGAPLLRRLLLCSLDPEGTTNIEKMISPTPRLRELVWEVEDRGPSFSWKGLTTLKTIHKIDMEECISILREACDTLVDATFTEIIETEKSPKDRNQVTLPFLTSLDISMARDEIPGKGFPEYLDLITTPVLEKLFISTSKADARFSNKAVLQLLTRSSPPLTLFQFESSANISLPDFRSFCDAAPNLEELMLAKCDLVKIIKYLSVAGKCDARKHSFILPSLKHLSLVEYDAPDGTLAPFMKSRASCRHVSPLETFFLRPRESKAGPKNDLRFLEKLEQGGLTLHWDPYRSTTRRERYL